MNKYDKSETRTDEIRKSLGTKSFLVAILIIAFGVFLMLKNMGVINDSIRHYIFSWPTIIMVIGFLNLNGKTGWFGFVMILFGGFFLLGDIYNWPFQFSKIFWPLLIILVGVAIIVFSNSKFRSRRCSMGTVDENKIEEIAIFGGSERIINAESFEGGEIVSIFGGSKIDFRRSKLAEGTSELSFINIFGGTAIMVPQDWNIKTEIVSIFGGFADKRFNTEVDQTKTLVIKGVAIFGGGEIKN